MELSARQQEIKDEFIRVRGTWGPVWDAVLQLDAEFLLCYLHLSAVPWQKNKLDTKTREFIYIAIDANATHMYLPGVRQHIRAALDAGAEGAEIMEVLELTATLGIHAMNIGVPILARVLSRRGESTPTELTPHQQDAKREFESTRGYWNAIWDDTLRLDPELFDAYLEFSSHPWKGGTLAPKVKEFIYIAFDVAATHLYVPGLELHIENALNQGASADEILEVMEIASVLGVHSVTSSAPILIDELEQSGSQPS